MKFFRLRRLKEEPFWTVEIFYPICPAVAEVRALDPLDALRTTLQSSLRRHGLTERNAFEIVWGVFFEEPGHFRISRKRASRLAKGRRTGKDSGKALYPS